MNRLRINDTVIVIAGKDKARTGKVLGFVSNDRVLVEGANLVKKHVRPNPNKNEQGGILEREAGLHISNVAILNPATNKADRVKFKFVGEGDNKKKVRCFVSNDEVIDV